MLLVLAPTLSERALVLCLGKLEALREITGTMSRRASGGSSWSLGCRFGVLARCSQIIRQSIDSGHPHRYTTLLLWPGPSPAARARMSPAARAARTLPAARAAKTVGSESSQGRHRQRTARVSQMAEQLGLSMVRAARTVVGSESSQGCRQRAARTVVGSKNSQWYSKWREQQGCQW